MNLAEIRTGVSYTIHKRTHANGRSRKNRDAAKLTERVVDARYYSGKALSRPGVYENAIVGQFDPEKTPSRKLGEQEPSLPRHVPSLGYCFYHCFR